MFKKYIFLTILTVIVASCTDQQIEKVSSINDYDVFLRTEKNESLRFAQKEKEFWSTKYRDTPNQVSYLNKLAGAHTLLFEYNGSIEDLKKSERLLIEANEKMNYTKVGLLHALSKNYSTQHRFKEALELLKKASDIGEKQQTTYKMLFDVYLELGDTTNAEKHLNNIKDPNDFDYLIRLSKWLDHNGDLFAAIRFMKKATQKAIQINDKNLLLWSYSNLADFYGHAGNIKASYQHYLKALAISPDYTYALKGIAWIVFSHEKNPSEALRIIEAIAQKKNTPDLLLLKADIAAYENKSDNSYLEQYLKIVEHKNYGEMYNSYTVNILSERPETIENAINIAQREIKNRTTPQSYDLLAWAYYKKGKYKEALQIVRNHIEDKTFEPMVRYHMAEIYKSNGLEELAMDLKKELLESTFELGPEESQKIQQL